MDLLNYIKTLNDDELDEFIESRIVALEENFKKVNSGVDLVGYRLDINNDEIILDQNPNTRTVKYVHKVRGYLPKNFKIVYGFDHLSNGKITNGGKYYYLDDDSYIKDFIKSIRDEDISDEFDLINYIYDYLSMYFGDDENCKVSRDDMFKLIAKDACNYYKPIEEHKLSDFKDRGNALCSERSIVGQNIMSFFNLDTILLFGHMEGQTNIGEDSYSADNIHAYNIFIKRDKRGIPDYENDVYLVDFTNPEIVYDIAGKIKYANPFVFQLENGFHRLIDFLNKDDSLQTYSLDYLLINGTEYPYNYSGKRNYFSFQKVKSKDNS